MYKVQKDAKKPELKLRICGKSSLTKSAGYGTMIIHTVILCLSMGIPSNKVILPQEKDAVKYLDGKIEENDNAPLRIVSNTHSIKKGCDDPYGNGQGRNVRQDHA